MNKTHRLALTVQTIAFAAIIDENPGLSAASAVAVALASDVPEEFIPANISSAAAELMGYVALGDGCPTWLTSFFEAHPDSAIVPSQVDL